MIDDNTPDAVDDARVESGTGKITYSANGIANGPSPNVNPKRSAPLTDLYLKLTGGTMLGTIVLASNSPVAANEAASKGYVDSKTSTFLPLSGGTMTGSLILAGDPTDANYAATKDYVDTSVATSLLKSSNLSDLHNANLSRVNLNRGITDLGNVAGTVVSSAQAGNVFTMTLVGNTVLGNPSSLVAGSTYLWIIYQDNTGGHSLTFGNIFSFAGTSVHSINPAACDIVTAIYDGVKLRSVMTPGFA